MEIHRFSNLGPGNKSYFEFLRTRQMSAGIYRLRAGATDEQRPHGEEEIYYVVSGIAKFRSAEGDVGVQPGDILYVPAREPHQFHEVEQDLQLLVFFAPPESS